MIEEERAAQARDAEIAANKKYMNEHPEVKATLATFLETAVHQKPTNVLGFAKAYFSKLMQPKPVIAPSILAADFGYLAKDCSDVLSAGADWLHVDVMDGHFVPNLSLGFPIIKSLSQALPHAFLDVHAMVSDPANWITSVKSAGAHIYTFHAEAVGSPEAAHALAVQVREAGLIPGLALKPSTPVDPWLSVISDKSLLGLILVMTVEPGFGGQKFMHSCLAKISAIRKLRADVHIQVDGGINEETVIAAAEAGANVAVAGTAIFGCVDRTRIIRSMRNSLSTIFS